MSIFKTDPVPSRKLYREVADRLRERIARGEFAPGAQLPSERELVALYQVGRPAVRKAMLTLDRMGMISISHGERSRVRAPTAQTVIGQIDETPRHMLLTSPDTLPYLREARLSFEIDMVRFAAAHRSEDDLSRLAQTLEAHQTGIREGEDLLGTDIAFHRAIAAIAGNPIYNAVSQAMMQWLAEFQVGSPRPPGAEDLTIAEHAEIYDRVAARDVDVAAQAMTNRLTRANKKYRRLEPSPEAAGGLSLPQITS